MHCYWGPRLVVGSILLYKAVDRATTRGAAYEGNSGKFLCRIIPPNGLGFASKSGYSLFMLSGISKVARIRFALVLIALYALGIIAPTAVLAFSAHCQPESAVSGHSHDHGGGPAEGHHGDDQKEGAPVHSHDDGSKCCETGVFSALAPDLQLFSAPAVFSSGTGVTAMRDFAGLPPDQLIRPPKSLS